jgi:pyruvate dehydrogenase E1 component
MVAVVVSADFDCSSSRPTNRRSHRAQQLGGVEGPIVAVSDFVKGVPDQIARWVPQPFIPLGTDGFGLSDVRTALGRHFEVDAAHIVVAVLYGLAQRGDVEAEVVADAIARYGIDPDALDPRQA